MKFLRSAKWWDAALTRAIKTCAQAIGAELTIGTTAGSIDWRRTASVALVAAVYSIVTSFAGLPEVKEE